MKKCASCKETKPLDSFYPWRPSKDGKYTYCNKCAAEKSRKWAAENPLKMKESKRWWRMRKRYGIDRKDYEKMYDQQGGKCAICGEAGETYQPSHTHPLLVDHCHATGQVRALLCHNCNSLIGHAKDSAGVLENAIAYLNRFQRSEAEVAL